MFVSEKLNGRKVLVAALAAPLFLLVSLSSVSPDLHDAIHPGEDHSPEHVCILTLIRDGLLEPTVELALVPSTVGLPVSAAPIFREIPDCRELPYRLPWAQAPPAIG